MTRCACAYSARSIACNIDIFRTLAKLILIRLGSSGTRNCEIYQSIERHCLTQIYLLEKQYIFILFCLPKKYEKNCVREHHLIYSYLTKHKEVSHTKFPCSFVDRHQIFGRICCFLLRRSQVIHTLFHILKTEELGFSETLILTYKLCNIAEDCSFNVFPDKRIKSRNSLDLTPLMHIDKLPPLLVDV